MTGHYKISITSEGKTIEIESSDLKWFEKKEKEYLGGLSFKNDGNLHDKKNSSEKPTTRLGGVTSINEFFKNTVRPRGVTARSELAVFFVYYLQRIKKQESIATSDILKCFGEIAYPNYSGLNYTDILTKAKKRALLNSVNKNWTLTITGEDFVLAPISTAQK